MTVKEYNKEFLPKIQRAREFINLFESTIQHMDDRIVDKEEVMRHFKIRCWSEETKETILTALSYYKKHEGLEKIRGEYMNTAEMWLKAQNDGKIYECINGNMAYSKDMGLINKDDFDDPWSLGAWDWEEQRGLDSLMNCKWAEMNVMTIEEAELKFGIKIIV